MRVSKDEEPELIRSYFRVLDRANLEDVLYAGKQCLERCRQFPKPAEWLAALPTRSPRSAVGDVHVMSDTDITEQAYAESIRHEQPPCPCVACVTAGVS